MAEDILDAVEASRLAFERPSLALLHRHHAPMVVAVLRAVFSASPEPIGVEDMHAIVDASRDRMIDAGVEDLPAGASGREWCRSWVNAGWMRRDQPAGAEDQVYVLTASAREAIDFIQRTTTLRGAGLSESRIRTILDAARRAALDAAPDREARIADLDAQIELLTIERDHLAAGGKLTVANDERMLEAYLNIAALLQGLPADFQRVAETESRNRRELVDMFRAENSAAGYVLQEYLEANDRLLVSTPEGRAFIGALDLLQSDEAMDALRADLQRILAHAFSEALLPSEQREFRTAADRIAASLRMVQHERHRTTAVIHRFVARPAGERASLSAALDRAAAAAERWLAATTPRSPVPADAAPLGRSWVPRLELTNLRQRLHPLAPPASPAPLHIDGGEHGTGPSTRAALLAMGGPHLHALRRLLRDIADRDPASPGWTLGEAFAAAADGDRRPVDFAGLLQLAARAQALPSRAGEGREAITARRPDGTTRAFSVPRLTITRADVLAIAGPDAPDSEAPRGGAAS